MGILQDSVAVRNAMLDAIETTIGTAPILRLITNVGAMPADCATAQAGTTTAALTLPTDYLANASAGSKARLGTWQGTASAAGDLHYWRLLDSTATTCHMQGPMARAWVTATAYSLGQRVTSTASNGVLSVYRCTTAIAASAAAPTVTSGTVADGSGVWTYESDASGVLVPDTFTVSNGQTINVSTFTRTRGNA